jgi:hypothetical protein
MSGRRIAAVWLHLTMGKNATARALLLVEPGVSSL